MKVYAKFDKQYEPAAKAMMWVHGLIEHQLEGGMHQLLPVRTNNLLERVWKVLKYVTSCLRSCYLLTLFDFVDTTF